MHLYFSGDTLVQMTQPPSYMTNAASYDFITHEGQAAQAIMPAGTATGTLSASFDNNKLNGTPFSAGTVTFANGQATLQLSAAEVDQIKDATYQILAGTTVIALGKITWTPNPIKPIETQIDADLAPVALSGNYNDLLNIPDLRATYDSWANRPGTELVFAEARTGVNVTTTTVNSAQDMAQFGLQVTVDPIGRPYLITARCLLGHSVQGGLVGARITEVSNGVDPVLTRIDYKAAEGVAGGPYYAWCEPELRVPAGPRSRTFKFQYVNLTTGTMTLYTPGFDASSFISSGNLALFIKAVIL